MANDPIAALRIAPNKPFSLASHDPAATLGWHKEAAKVELDRVKLRLDVLQQRLYAEERHSVLLVLQAMDAAGKDGTIRNILAGLNPAGFHVSNFGVPGLGVEVAEVSDGEALAFDFLQFPQGSTDDFAGVIVAA